MINLFIGFIIEDNNYINAIKNTFLKDNNIDYKFFSNKDIEECIKINNYYEIFEWVNEKINPEFFFICNQDVYIIFNNLLNLIKTLNNNDLIYVGGHGDFRILGNNKFYFHSPNPGIILSNASLKQLSNSNLLNEYNNICKKNNSDLINIGGVAVGYHACLFNFKLINDSNFFYCNYNGYPCHKGEVNKESLISCSNMSVKDIYNYYKILNKINKKNDNNKLKLIIYPSGGLGNILFQYFNAINLSIEKNYELFFIKNLNYWRGDINKYNLFNDLNYINENEIIEDYFIRLNEEVSYYKPLELVENTNYILWGYFQSYKYFINNIETIKNKLISNVNNEYNQIKLYYKQLCINKTCLIHVRRGDYIMYPNQHPLCTDNYYINAIDTINNINSDVTYILFSDDIPFISDWSVIKKFKYKIIYEVDPVKTLLLMSLCDYFIIANSTLSLCAYFLRNNSESILIGPKNWFGPNAPKYKLEDILPPEAIII
jgi:hypothetical protein